MTLKPGELYPFEFVSRRACAQEATVTTSMSDLMATITTTDGVIYRVPLDWQGGRLYCHKDDASVLAFCM